MSPAIVRRGRQQHQLPDYWSLGERYVPLAGRNRLVFSMRNVYRPERNSPRQIRLRTVSYWYEFSEQDSSELISFHWHPHRPGQPSFPHLHMESRFGSVVVLKRNHVPSGRVSFESVVRFAIEELGVRPLRPDWDAVLAIGEQHFVAQRSW